MDTGLTQEQVLKNLQNIGYKAPLTNPVGGAIANGMITQDGTNPISADTIGMQKPAILPEKPLVSPYTGMGEQFMESAKGVQAQEAEKVSKYEQGVKEGATDIMSLIEGLGGQEVKRQEAYQQQGVFDKKAQYDDIVSKMESRNIATKRRIEDVLKNNPEGQSRQALQATIDQIESENARYQADRAIELSAIGRDFDRAREIVDMKIDAETSAMKAELEAKKFFFEFNKDMFTKAEQRQYESKLRSEEREIRKEEGRIESISKIYFEAAKNGATQAVLNKISTAQSIEEAMQLASGSLQPKQVSGTILDNLPVSIQNRIYSSATKFSTTDTVKRYNAAVESVNLVNGINSNSQNPADHQAIVYAFAKALDPDSAVKEGEYETIKRYAQSALDKYGKEITNAINGTGFLSEAAIKNIQTTMNNALNSRKKSYDNLYSETSRTINNWAGKDVADAILIDYASAQTTQGVDVYSEYRSQLQNGEILVERNGVVGAIPAKELLSTDKKL